MDEKLTPATARKQGFGLVEVLASMVILALMFNAVMYMQYWNRVASLRIQARNEATILGQHIIDSLEAQGLPNVKPITNKIMYGGQRGLTQGGTAQRSYTVNVTVDSILSANPVTFSDTTYAMSNVTAKPISVNVAWTMNGGSGSVTLSAVVE